MLDIAYTKGQELQRKIDILEEARRDLHVAPISKKAYYHLAWDATLTRIENTLRLSGTVVNKREIYKALTSGKPQTETAERISRSRRSQSGSDRGARLIRSLAPGSCQLSGERTHASR